jgi:hypothetical protein
VSRRTQTIAARTKISLKGAPNLGNDPRKPKISKVRTHDCAVLDIVDEDDYDDSESIHEEINCDFDSDSLEELDDEDEPDDDSEEVCDCTLLRFTLRPTRNPSPRRNLAILANLVLLLLAVGWMLTGRYLRQ